MKNSILLIDDDSSFVKRICFTFPQFSITEALDPDQALSVLRNTHFDLILLDLKLNPANEELSGLELLPELKSLDNDVPIIIVTSDNSTDTVVAAMKLGADDFLRKSEFDTLGWQKKFDLHIKNRELSNRLRNIEADQFGFIGNSKQIQEIKSTLESLSSKPQITVLLFGETGTGKEIAARYLHYQGPRRKKPFVPVQLSAIQENLLDSALFGHKKGSYTGASQDRNGFFRSAEKGVLFLDEISEIPLEIQVKILRFLDTKSIYVLGEDKETQLDVQIVTATNRDLKPMVEKGEFRADLYYRIKNFQVELPPLRYRSDDIPLLLEHFLNKQGISAEKEMLDRQVMEEFYEYSWPGNIRELKNAVETMVLKMRLMEKKRITLDCLPADILDSSRTTQKNTGNQSALSLSDLDYENAFRELGLMEKLLKESTGSKSTTADQLGLTADQFRYRVNKYFSKYPVVKDSFPVLTAAFKLNRKKSNV